jgi:hypothetical protein
LVEMAYGRVSGLVDTVFVILKNIKWQEFYIYF